MILGDFNINWSSKSDRKKLKDITGKHNLSQMVKGPTRIARCSNTQIDLIFCNRPERITTSYNFTTGISDQNLVLMCRKLTKKRFIYRNDEKKTSYRIPRKDMHLFEEHLNLLDWTDFKNDNRPLNDKCTSFLNIIGNVKDKFMKKCTHGCKKSNLPWINEELWSLMKKRDHAFKTAIKSKLDNDYRIFKGLRNKVISTLCKSKANFFIDLINQARGNGQQIWKHLNTMSRKTTKGNKPLELNINGNISRDDSEIALAFNTFFKESQWSSLSGLFGLWAFDTVNHNVLVSKLSSHNISSDTIKWFPSYLSTRKNCTRINDSLSTENICSIGVPQGSILGPLLFSIYI